MPRKLRTDTPRPDVARRLKQARTWIDMTQDQMAAELECSREMVGEYERGVRMPPSEVLARWAEVTDRGLDWLWWGDEGRPTRTVALAAVRSASNHRYSRAATNARPRHRRSRLVVAPPRAA